MSACAACGHPLSEHRHIPGTIAGLCRAERCYCPFWVDPNPRDPHDDMGGMST